jgi:hypothetical protein
MFYELIYTRCRQGLDITRKGQQISGDGYKVYSCTPAIMEEGKVDLQLLANSAQIKQPCADPGFMDDAYLFYVPDSGKSFFINFHPVPFDANAQGDYAHRPGNFVNNALIGDFSNVYPYKMFQDDAIWNAKTKGEAYYYEKNTDKLPERVDIVDPPGRYKFDEIGAFIADGRKEALAKAVAFLIAQYNEEPEKRKYLVIKDETSKNIELWIAAIECAFSPQIACVIPFATRMDKFVNTNRYTVKLGVYQQQMNLQDPAQKQRYRAMIVGVDERDKANISACRPLANSPFVLLDGKLKQAAFDADISSNGYYRLITKFDGEHQKFCEEFLQTFCDLKPNSGIYDLYDIFTALNNPSLPDTRALAGALDRLGKYKAANTGVYADIYGRVNKEVSRFMQEDFSYALNITNWLLTASAVTGDSGAKQRLTEVVCKTFAGIIFGKTDNTAKKSYWAQIKNTGFKMDASRVVTDNETIRGNSSALGAFAPADAAAFIAVYLEAASLTGGVEQQTIKKIVKYGINICCRNDDTKTLQEILSIPQVKNTGGQEFLFSLVKGEDKKMGEFVIKYIIERDAAISASDDSVRSFCKKLKEEGLENLSGSALIKRAGSLNKLSEIERFIKTVQDMSFIGEGALAKVFESLDAKIDTSNDALVELLQTRKPDGAKCKNSAHSFALNILSGNRRKKSLTETFKDLTSQGFPSVTDGNYIEKLAEGLIKAGMDEKEQSFMLDILLRAPKEYFSAYILKLTGTAAKHQDKWNALFNSVSDGRNKQIDDDIVQALSDSKQNEKSLTALGNLLTNGKSRKYYDDLANKAWENIMAQKGKSGAGKLFGGKSGSGDDKRKEDR